MEDLNDPLGDRVMKNVPPMARDPLIRSKLWHKSSKYQFFEMPHTFFHIEKSGGREVPNMELLRSHLLREGHLEKVELMEILRDAMNIMKKEPNVLRIKEPVIIVGDIHG